MSERKLYQVLKGLDDADIREFEATLRDDKRAAGKRMWKFYATLRKKVLLPELPPDQVKDAENAVAKLLAENNEDLDQAFRRWCNKLLEKLHSFMIGKEVELMPSEFQQLLLLRAYERRAMADPFRSQYKAFQRKLTDMPRGDLYYELRFRAGQIEIEIENPGNQLGRADHLDISPHYENLDHKYLYHLARANTYLLMYNQFRETDFPTRHLEFMWELAQKIDRKEHPGIDIYLDFIDLISQEITAENIFRFEKKVREIYHLLEPLDRYVMYGYCISKAAGLLNRGNHQLRRPIFEILLFGVENELVMSEGKMDFKFYRILAITAIEEGEIDLLHRFMREYAEDKVWYDYPGQKEALSLLVEAKILMEEKDFEQALSKVNHLFQNYKLIDTSMQVDFRTTKLQLLYLLSQWRQGFSTLESFRGWLNYNTDYLNQNALKLIDWRLKWFRRLFRLGSDGPKKVPKLLSELENAPEYRLKGWFREQLQKLL